MTNFTTKKTFSTKQFTKHCFHARFLFQPLMSCDSLKVKLPLNIVTSQSFQTAENDTTVFSVPHPVLLSAILTNAERCFCTLSLNFLLSKSSRAAELEKSYKLHFKSPPVKCHAQQFFPFKSSTTYF